MLLTYDLVISNRFGRLSHHAGQADGQQVQLFAFKDSYDNSPPEWHQAGEHPVKIILRHVTAAKRKPGIS
jgi:hypothetical protein